MRTSLVLKDFPANRRDHIGSGPSFDELKGLESFIFSRKIPFKILENEATGATSSGVCRTEIGPEETFKFCGSSNAE